MFSQEHCERWLPSIRDVPSMPVGVGDKPVFLKLLRRVWEKHPSYNASTTILVDDCRYKSLKNAYENCLAIRSYEPSYQDPYYPLYLNDLVKPWLQNWIIDPYPTAYSRQHPIFDVEDDLSPIVANYFVEREGYTYLFDPPVP